MKPTFNASIFNRPINSLINIGVKLVKLENFLKFEYVFINVDKIKYGFENDLIWFDTVNFFFSFSEVFVWSNFFLWNLVAFHCRRKYSDKG